MAEAQNIQLTIEAGEVSGFTAPIYDASGNLITSLLGYTAYVRFSDQPVITVSTPAKLELSTENGGVVRSIYGFQFTITAANSRTLTNGSWQMVVTDPNGTPTRIYEGPVKIKPEITGVVSDT